MASPRRNKTRTALMGLVLVTGAALSTGCRNTLFSPKSPRSQFQAYDQIRNQHEPQVIFDAYGRPKPNLRGRLTPKQ
jgi:hypothetical protein